jgi:streptogramin lyase
MKSVGRPMVLLGATLLASALLAGTAEGYVYWTNAQSGTIGRALPNGTGVDQSFIKTGGMPSAVAVDGAHIYWAHHNEEGQESIGRANLDGSGKDPNFILGVSFPSGVAVNATHVFWTEAIASSCDITLTNCIGFVGRANLDGTGVDYDFIRTQGSTHGVAVNSTHIYWGGLTGDEIGFIGRANLSGSGAVHKLISDVGAPSGPSLSGTHIYWANAFGDELGRANLNGTGANRSFIPGGTPPWATAVHGGQLYWTDSGGDSIGRANLDGSGADRKFITGAKSPEGIAVDSIGQDEFSFGKVKRNKKKGTAKLTVNVPRAGGLVLAKTKKVKGAQKRAEAPGSVKLRIKPKGKAKKKLGKKGKAKVEAEVTYTPDGGAPSTKAKRVKLKKK